MGTKRAQIFSTFKEVSSVKQDVYTQTKHGFDTVVKVLKQMLTQYQSHLQEVDERVVVKFVDKGKHQCRFHFGGDALVFHMHSNVFTFSPDHPIHQHSFFRGKKERGYFGVIHIYNFLADSFKLNRDNDLGYLIARVFINKDGHCFIEGQGELNAEFKQIEDQVISEDFFENVIESAIQFALDFELFVPSFEKSQLITVGNIKQLSNREKTVTAKRLGFKMSHEESDEKKV
jgi:hypothetical protein